MKTTFLPGSFLLLCLWLLSAVSSVANSSPPRTLLIVGDSLSAAYGLDTHTGWPRLLQARLDTLAPDSWQVVNASISGETTDGGLRRLPGLLSSHRPEVVVIELGGNDGLRGFPPDLIRANLAAMIELAQQQQARVLLVGIAIPPNYGPRYTRAFTDIYTTLAEDYNTALLPFFLDGIYQAEEMMQRDGLHPTREAQPHLLENIWPHLITVLGLDTASLTD